MSKQRQPKPIYYLNRYKSETNPSKKEYFKERLRQMGIERPDDTEIIYVKDKYCGVSIKVGHMAYELRVITWYANWVSNRIPVNV